ncbi:MAG: DUF1178 family protein [Burkholderiaceae bacterium]
MKVLDLRCDLDHRFEGWFGGDADYESQHERSLIACPLCNSTAITRLPSAPRLNVSGAREPVSQTAVVTTHASQDVVEPIQAAQAAWLRAVRHMMVNTVDVGPRFAEEARRIHYGEKAQRGIRGQATREEAEALRDEGIEVMSVPLPAGLTDGLQ